MKLKQAIARIIAYPIVFFSSPAHNISSIQNLNPSESQSKPVKVSVVPTAGAKAAMMRDWVMALFFGLFAGITVHDKFLKPNNADRVDTLIKSLDLNGDGHISKDELEKVKEFIKILEEVKK